MHILDKLHFCVLFNRIYLLSWDPKIRKVLIRVSLEFLSTGSCHSSNISFDTGLVELYLLAVGKAADAT